MDDHSYYTAIMSLSSKRRVPPVSASKTPPRTRGVIRVPYRHQSKEDTERCGCRPPLTCLSRHSICVLSKWSRRCILASPCAASTPLSCSTQPAHQSIASCLAPHICPSSPDSLSGSTLLSAARWSLSQLASPSLVSPHVSVQAVLPLRLLVKTGDALVEKEACSTGSQGV